MKLYLQLTIWLYLGRVCVRLGNRALAWYMRHSPMLVTPDVPADYVIIADRNGAH